MLCYIAGNSDYMVGEGEETFKKYPGSRVAQNGARSDLIHEWIVFDDLCLVLF